MLRAGLNVMTLSWMTPVNNYGGFAFAIHKTRYSSSNLLSSKKFTLSVPTAESRDLVLAVGRVSGKVAKKFDGSLPNLKAGVFGVLGTPGDKVQLSATAKKSKNSYDILFDDDNGDENDESISTEEAAGTLSSGATGSPADKDKQSTFISTYAHHSFPAPIDGTVAHMQCTVLSYTDAADAGTYLVIANVNKASVHPQYWSNKGKCFVAADTLDDHLVTLGAAEASHSISNVGLQFKKLPPILSFLGSQRFGHLVSE
jgi:flavin reductase (DIM6/NTAB) family NADH-FMN oxidoreductase RutF